MTIRKYTPADDMSIIELLRLNTPKYFAPEEEKGLLDYLANHIDHYYVVEEAGQLIGSGGFNLSAKNAVLSWDIIHPRHQGKGIGRVLTRYRIDRIKELKDIQKIAVRTSQLTYKFYEKFGFELKETIKDHWADGFDLYGLELDISL